MGGGWWCVKALSELREPRERIPAQRGTPLWQKGLLPSRRSRRERSQDNLRSILKKAWKREREPRGSLGERGNVSEGAATSGDT